MPENHSDSVNSLLSFNSITVTDPGEPESGIDPKTWEINGVFVFDTLDRRSSFLDSLQEAFLLITDFPEITSWK